MQSMPGTFHPGDPLGHFPLGQGHMSVEQGPGVLGQDTAFAHGHLMQSIAFHSSSTSSDDGQSRAVESSHPVPWTKWKCKVCGLKYKTQWGLTVHMGKQHCDNPGFRCELCGRGFTMKDHYEGHMNVHNRIKAFQCPNCPKAFAHKTSLRAHMKVGACSRQSLCE